MLLPRALSVDAVSLLMAERQVVSQKGQNDLLEEADAELRWH